MTDDSELLFFDTFSHDSSEDLNLDLVQFPRPVFVHEIRIIPLGTRVQADFPGGHRLGATNPSTFQLEFFVNDLYHRGACTFEKIGSFEYKQNVDIQFLVSKKIPTDGLVLRGSYSTITLAVYGVLTKVSKERSPPPPPPQASSRASVGEAHQGSDFDRIIDPIPPTKPDWEREPRTETNVDVRERDPPPPPPPPPTVRHPPVIEPIRYSEPAPIPRIIPSEGKHPPYADRPPYQDPIAKSYPPHHHSSSGHHGSSYGPYESGSRGYSKPWSGQDDPYPPPKPEPYERIPPPYEGQERYPPPSLAHAPIMPWEQRGDSRDDIRGSSRDAKRRDRDRDWERYPTEPSERYRGAKDYRARDKDSRRDREKPRDIKANDPPSRGERRAEVHKRPPSPASPGRTVSRPRTPPPVVEQDKISSKARGDAPQDRPDGDAPHTQRGSGKDDPFEPLTPEHSPSDMYNVSDGEIQEGEALLEDDPYEEIISEEEDMSDIDDRALEMGEMEYVLCDDAWNSMTSFNPFQCELLPLQHFGNSRLTEFEIAREKLPASFSEELPEDSQKLLQLLDQFSDKEHHEKWVEAVETLATTLIISGLANIPTGDTYNSTVQTLVSWLKEALNFELALQQPQTPYKVRHMKAGLRLATTLFQSNKEIVNVLLLNSVVKQVLELYNKPYMSLPVKLLIVRTLDAVAFTSEGICHLLGEKFKVEEDSETTFLSKNDAEKEPKGNRWMTGYQYLIEIMMSKQSTRAVVALSALMKKLHMHEVLQELEEIVEKILQGTVEVGSPKGDADTDSDHGAATVSAVPASCIENATSCLNGITHIYKNAYRVMAQPLRYLPTQFQFEVTQSPFNPYPGLLRMFQDSHLLESIFVLVSSPSTAGHSGILTSVRELLNEVLQSNLGVQFLASNNELMNDINRALLQAVDENRDESGDDGIAHQLGLQLVCTLQAFQYIDALMAYHGRVGTKKEKEFDEPEAVTSLHQLYCLTFSLVGKSAVIALLAMNTNLDSLFPFVEMTGDDEFNTKLSKSVCCAYATELLLLTVHHSESIALLQFFGQRFLALSQQELTPKLQEFAQWMLPIKNVTNFNHESIGQLTSIVKKCSEESTVLSPELITTLRILQHIVFPTNTHEKEDTELKYKYGVIHVFSNEGLASFLLILQKLCDTFLKPSHQAVSLVGQQGVLVLAIIKPIVSIMQLILSYLIACRETEFKDLTAVPILLRLHTLVSLYPMTWHMYSVAQQVQSSIVETLLAYTQPSLGLMESEEALSKSLWSQMVGEILKYSVVATGTYMTGFTLLSELLPLPLPLQTKEPLTAEEETKAVNTRKLWSAHLLPLSDGIRAIILGIAATSCQPLQQLLRRVCVQLADLASPTAIVVVRAILDALYEHIGTSPGTEEEPEPKPCLSSAARILNFLSYMASNATFKVALLHILKGSVKLDEKYSDVLSKLLSLLNCTSSKASHLHAQECIVSILQSLCDPDIGLITVESGASVQDVLASSLPNKDILMQIATNLLQHVGNSQHPFASVLPSVRTLVMLTEHDLGFFCLKNAMENGKTELHSLFVRLAQSFSKDSSDCLSTLSTSLELLRLMVQVYEEGLQFARTLLLPASELADYLKWMPSKKTAVVKKEEDAGGEVPKKDKTEEEKTLHPLLDLEKLVMECCSSEEEVLESLLENISGIISILNEGAESEKLTKDYPEIVLPPCESLASQFTARTVYVVGDVDEALDRWLGMPGVDDVEQEPEQVPTDIVSLMEKFCHDFDLKQALESLCLAGEGTDDLDKKGSKRKYQPLANPSSLEAPSKKPFIAPMRGRGFPRGSSRANDPFRSRPPNTSRPPSMHVDDFLAMESHHPSSDSAANSKRPVKAGPPLHRVQSNYRTPFNEAVAFQDPCRGRGRFFSPPGPYGRREITSRASNNTQRPLPRTPAIPMPSMWGMRSGNQIGAAKSQNAARVFPRNSVTDRPPINPRSRDPYGLVLGLSVPDRFGRNTGSTPLVPLGAMQLNWSDNRNKSPDGRFVVPSGPVRGRRDVMGRHARSFTR